LDTDAPEPPGAGEEAGDAEDSPQLEERERRRGIVEIHPAAPQLLLQL
jgi:hypothetical protein